MKILLLSCSTGEGHNHCALAVKEALDARGHETSFLDMLHMFGAPGPLSFDKILNRISTKAPDVFGMMYHAGAMYSATGVTSPVYMANIRHARQLNAFIRDNGYDAVVCSHLFPMETLTFLRRWERCEVKCCGILSDYTCIPFLAETDLDAYFLPHSEVRELCIQAGMPAEKLIVSGMPVAARFLAPMDKAAARAALGLPADKKIYLIMTGGIGCGDAVSLCDAIRRVPDENALLCVLPGRNEALRQALEDAYHGQGVLTVPFTDQVPAYMHAADVLLSKAGGISSSEAAMLGVPLVHTMAIPGVETENAAFFARHGLSFFARSVDEAARFADRLIYDPACAERMLAAQAAWLPRNGAEQIAAAVRHNEKRKQRPVRENVPVQGADSLDIASVQLERLGQPRGKSLRLPGDKLRVRAVRKRDERRLRQQAAHMADVQCTLEIFLAPIPVRHTRRRLQALWQRIVETGVKHVPDIAPVHPPQDHADILHRRLTEALRRKRPADQRQVSLRKPDDEIVAQGKAPRQPPRRDRTAHGHAVQPPERADAPLRQPVAQLGRDGLHARVGRLFVRVMRRQRRYDEMVPRLQPLRRRLEHPPAQAGAVQQQDSLFVFGSEFMYAHGRPSRIYILNYDRQICAALSSAGSKKIVRPEGESGGRFFVGDSGHAQAKCVVSHRCREWGKRREVR